MSTTLPQIIVAERPHSSVGPSSFERAETCTASVLTEGKLKRSSIYADEGTTAHALMDSALIHDIEPVMWLGKDVITPDGEVIGTVTMEMAEHITECVDWIKATLQPGFRTETRLIMPDSRVYGYSDVFGVASDGLLTVIDLKYGAGTWVEANTVQIGLYGLMVLVAYGVDPAMMDQNTPIIRSVIMQPRMGKNHFRQHLWTAGALVRLQARVRALDHRLDAQDYRYKSGAHCRWCDRAGLCPQLKLVVEDAALAEISFDPANPGDISVLDDYLDMLPAVEKWVKAVRETVDGYIKAGGQMKNARLVQGRYSRTWTDPDKGLELLKTYGVDPYKPREMLTVPAAEKLLPAAAKAKLKEMTTTLPGAPRVAIGDEGGTPVSNPQIAEGFQRTLDVQAAKNLLVGGAQAE